MGWQGRDPSTDFRGAGFISLENLLFFAKTFSDEWAFDLLYCVAFVVMDKQWLDKNASYMDFNEVLKSTRTQLERELMLDDVMRIEDMPSYSLLC
nr:unnamed protein product [Digitaria exilis]